MKKEEVMQLFMVAMAVGELEIINALIKSLEHYKDSLKLWNDDNDDKKRPPPPMMEMIIMLTKFQIIDMSYTDIFKMINEHENVVRTAMEFHEMLNNETKN